MSDEVKTVGAALRLSLGVGGSSVVLKEEDWELRNAARKGPHKYRYTSFFCETQHV